MSGWAARRFWQEVTVEPVEGGWSVRLDARLLRTPAKAPLVVPTPALAEALAAEWRAVEGTVDPRLMPVTRGVNAAIDKVVPQRAEVAALIAEYGGTDLLCYRAEAPAELVARQAAGWDPMLRWAAETHGVVLRVTRGIAPVQQPRDSLERLRAKVDAVGPFELAALHDLVALSGSLILGLAATDQHFSPDALWQLSRIDENWQAELWGEDSEAAIAAANKRRDFLAAHNFWKLLHPVSP
ncbi:MAG: ATPase [Defluviimonas sp.]|uniref:ATP12 family chaperone protein n=1 Tax=Albidovulum sp. TaxID=1872424 RepID=UPI002A2AC07F|nr:ATPase [Defluviimonas sp.]